MWPVKDSDNKKRLMEECWKLQKSNYFAVDAELHQGCRLSPAPFTISRSKGGIEDFQIGEPEDLSSDICRSSADLGQAAGAMAHNWDTSRIKQPDEETKACLRIIHMVLLYVG